MINKNISQIRREYKLKQLDEESVQSNPIDQFELWFNEALAADIIDPNAMILATADRNSIPSARTVLLKDFDQRGFVFFTNYESSKSKELAENPHASLLFYWKELERQIRITGKAEKISSEESKIYFDSRPFEARISALASKQSAVIPSRKFLVNRYNTLRQKYADGNVPYPEFWGGYRIIPSSIEFWQGRENRLHDRINYKKNVDGWMIERLSP